MADPRLFNMNKTVCLRTWLDRYMDLKTDIELLHPHQSPEIKILLVELQNFIDILNRLLTVKLPIIINYDIPFLIHKKKTECWILKDHDILNKFVDRYYNIFCKNYFYWLLRCCRDLQSKITIQNFMPELEGDINILNSLIKVPSIQFPQKVIFNSKELKINDIFHLCVTILIFRKDYNAVFGDSLADDALSDVDEMPTLDFEEAPRSSLRH